MIIDGVLQLKDFFVNLFHYDKNTNTIEHCT